MDKILLLGKMAVTLKLMLQFDAHYDVEYSLF